MCHCVPLFFIFMDKYPRVKCTLYALIWGGIWGPLYLITFKLWRSSENILLTQSRVHSANHYSAALFREHLTSGEEVLLCHLTSCFNPLNPALVCHNYMHGTQLQGGCRVVAEWPHLLKSVHSLSL